jgi:hypothetical protein
MGLAALSLIVVGCVPAPSGTPVTEAEAVALVLAQETAFAGIQPRDETLIGQASWYEARETDGGWEVVVRIGWGDCPAGCINEHVWTYEVSSAGEVALASEAGDPMPTEATVRGTVTAGPTCPVVTDPPDPSCADRPVEGAVLIVTTLEGQEVARVLSDAEGVFELDLAPGSYRLEPQPVEGLMGTAEASLFSVELGGPVLEIPVIYDTGIR